MRGTFNDLTKHFGLTNAAVTTGCRAVIPQSQ